MVSSDFRKEAREKLSGKWGKAVAIMLAYILISFILSFIENKLEKSVSSIASSIISIIVAIIEVPLSFGLVMSFLKLFNEQEVGAFDFLQSGFENFKKSWSVTLNTFVKMLGPIILFIVAYVISAVSVSMSLTNGLFGSRPTATPRVLAIFGVILTIVSLVWIIVRSYYYQLAVLIAAENEGVTGKEAVEESRRRMEGKRGKLFCLQLSFIGWAILAAFSLGIGYLWLAPYIQFATISFYKNTNTVSTDARPEMPEE